MALSDTNPVGGFWGMLFGSPEERTERRKQKALAREKQREEERQVAKELKESGYFDQCRNAYIYGHFYL